MVSPHSGELLALALALFDESPGPDLRAYSESLDSTRSMWYGRWVCASAASATEGDTGATGRQREHAIGVRRAASTRGIRWAASTRVGHRAASRLGLMLTSLGTVACDVAQAWA